jgi:hypothetical protein
VIDLFPGPTGRSWVQGVRAEKSPGLLALWQREGGGACGVGRLGEGPVAPGGLGVR